MDNSNNSANNSICFACNRDNSGGLPHSLHPGAAGTSRSRLTSLSSQQGGGGDTLSWNSLNSLSSTASASASSQHSSPRSTAALLPSPPDSPDSLTSSLPSVSSSFFFSSGAASPHSHPHSHPHSQHGGHEHELAASNVTEGLIIPSLTLPTALPRPTYHGQTLGEVSLLFVGPDEGAVRALAEYVVEDGEVVVDVGEWEEVEGSEKARSMHASTDWIEERDMHGLETLEGARNVRIVEMEGFKLADDPESIIAAAKAQVHAVFEDVRRQTGDVNDNTGNDECCASSPSSSPLLHSLLSSSHSPLFTALLYVTSSAFTPQDHAIISALSSTIPVIPYSTCSSVTCISFDRERDRLSSTLSHSQLASFQPRTAPALRAGLLRSPRTLDALRAEAADRYMRWRESERAVEDILRPSICSPVANSIPKLSPPNGGWKGRDRQRWNKAEWEASLSEDVARLRAERVGRRRPLHLDEDFEFESDSDFEFELEERQKEKEIPCHGFTPILDPLHFRSLMMLSLSLLSPRRLASRAKYLSSSPPPAPAKRAGRWRWGMTLLGVFCAGVGIGLALSGTV